MMRNAARGIIREALGKRPVEPYEPAARHLLFIRPDHLGDLLFVRPALKRFREQLPDWRITLMVGPWSRSIVERDPHVDEIIAFPFPGFTREAGSNPVEPYRQLFAAARQIRDLRPAAVVILRDDHWWGALAARQSGARIVIGSDHPTMKSLLTDHVPVEVLHAVARNDALLKFTAAKLGSGVDLSPANVSNAPLTWEIADADRERANQLLRITGINGRYVVIHPGSGAPVKLWPTERWARVADRIGDASYAVVLTGSDSEAPLLRRIAAEARQPIHAFAGRTSIAELAALFQQSEAVLGVDSGPLHLAVAVGSPTLHLYGPSDVAVYGPWGDAATHRVLRAAMTCPACGNLSLDRPEGAGCMLAIQAEQVIESFCELVEP